MSEFGKALHLCFLLKLYKILFAVFFSLGWTGKKVLIMFSTLLTKKREDYFACLQLLLINKSENLKDKGKELTLQLEFGKLCNIILKRENEFVSHIDRILKVKEPENIEPTYDGKIIVIIGPMCCGKTSELKRLIERYEIAKMKTYIIKSSIDTRTKGLYCSTHSLPGKRNGSKFKVDKAIKNLEEIDYFSDLKDVDVIGIVEGQFFEDLDIFVEMWANYGKIVIVESLSGDSNREQFGKLAHLIPKCDVVEFKRAVCVNCGEDASFSKKKNKSKSQKQIEIGGTDTYEAVCRKCYFSKREEK